MSGVKRSLDDWLECTEELEAGADAESLSPTQRPSFMELVKQLVCEEYRGQWFGNVDATMAVVHMTLYAGDCRRAYARKLAWIPEGSVWLLTLDEPRLLMIMFQSRVMATIYENDFELLCVLLKYYTTTYAEKHREMHKSPQPMHDVPPLPLPVSPPATPVVAPPPCMDIYPASHNHHQQQEQKPATRKSQNHHRQSQAARSPSSSVSSSSASSASSASSLPAYVHAEYQRLQLGPSTASSTTSSSVAMPMSMPADITEVKVTGVSIGSDPVSQVKLEYGQPSEGPARGDQNCVRVASGGRKLAKIDGGEHGIVPREQAPAGRRVQIIGPRPGSRGKDRRTPIGDVPMFPGDGRVQAGAPIITDEPVSGNDDIFPFLYLGGDARY